MQFMPGGDVCQRAHGNFVFVRCERREVASSACAVLPGPPRCLFPGRALRRFRKKRHIQWVVAALGLAVSRACGHYNAAFLVTAENSTSTNCRLTPDRFVRL